MMKEIMIPYPCVFNWRGKMPLIDHIILFNECGTKIDSFCLNISLILDKGARLIDIYLPNRFNEVKVRNKSCVLTWNS